ncbi:MAG TPA: putative toxin-antitoxin system toxin component, PIN family [Candidatus Acidoferrum sp.]|nr:putative toxin-antitoxin system toxin component, PIN family [Candidatus Acidoferrum sp.]
MKRIVLDTSVLVAALRSRSGAGNAVLRLVAERRLVLLATPPLFLEYEEVLHRPEHRLVHGLSPQQLESVLEELAALIEPVELHFRWRPQVHDTNDEMVLEAAINGDASALVTYNTGDFSVAAERFGVAVLTPAQLLRKVKP